MRCNQLILNRSDIVITCFAIGIFIAEFSGETGWMTVGAGCLLILLCNGGAVWLRSTLPGEASQGSPRAHQLLLYSTLIAGSIAAAVLWGTGLLLRSSYATYFYALIIAGFSSSLFLLPLRSRKPSKEADAAPKRSEQS